MPPTRAGALAAMAVVLAASCSGRSRIDGRKAEAFVRGEVQPRPTRVTCPRDVTAQKGKTFYCNVELPNGGRGTMTVHMTDDKGTIRVGPGDLQIYQ